MSKAIITLEEDGDHVKAILTYVNGFNPKSNAHQHANIIMKIMDDIAIQKPIAQPDAALLADAEGRN